MVTVEYKVVVETDSYAGNFEREMCAFMTGIYGDCGVGRSLSERHIRDRFDGKVTKKSDDTGTWRPVEIGEDFNSFVIFFESAPSTSDMQLLHERAIIFADEVSREGVKYLGIKSVRVETITTVEEAVLTNIKNNNT